MLLSERVCVMYRRICGLLPENRPTLQYENLLWKPTLERKPTNLYCLTLNCLIAISLVWCLSFGSHGCISTTPGNRNKANSLPCKAPINSVFKLKHLCGKPVFIHFWSVARAANPSFATRYIKKWKKPWVEIGKERSTTGTDELDVGAKITKQQGQCQ